MSIEEQRRARFEATYAKPSGVQWNRLCQEYQETWEELGDDRLDEIKDYNMMFRVWRKALDSVVIELPESFRADDGVTGVSLVLDSFQAYEAIKRAGLKVKP